MSKETERPSFMHGTNEGRVNIPMRGPGTMGDDEAGKAKAQIESQNLLCLAMEQDTHEGGYRRGKK